jgi:phosphoglycerate dehydrogenase-like enzyme
MQTIHVLSTMGFSDDLLARIRAVSERIQVTQHTVSRAADVPAQAFAQAEVLYTFGALPEPEQAPCLRWVQLNSAGANHVLNHPLFARDVTFTNNSGLHATIIGEYVLASMLAWSRHLPALLDLKHRREWPSDRTACCQPAELRGATVGIVGYGSIGREVGRLAHAFGMRVLAFKRNAETRDEPGQFAFEGLGDHTGDLPDAFFGPPQLREMLAQCDYVVIAVPLTPDTHHLIGEAELRATKPTAYLVNIARGQVCDEPALVRALQQGWITGAGLDVFAQEPLPQDSPLWSLPNVILTPHISGFSPHYEQRALDIFTENLRRYVAGQPLLNVVNTSTGY